MPFTEQTLASLKKAGLSDENIKAISTLGHSSIPATALISEMGFNKDVVAKLPAAVHHLTKADLLSLGGWGTTHLTPAASKVTATEVSSIKSVLGAELALPGRLVSVDISCCCCCPCCCAAAVTVDRAARRN